jgi:hypothetical protein
LTDKAITQDRMENAMEYLTDTDDAFAAMKTLLARTEILAKRARARIFLTGDKGSVEAKKAAAETHTEVCAADDTYIEAMREYETLKARRSRAEILIEVWRTLEASRRRT